MLENIVYMGPVLIPAGLLAGLLAGWIVAGGTSHTALRTFWRSLRLGR